MRSPFDARLFGMYHSPLLKGMNMIKDDVAIVLVAWDQVDHELVSAVKRVGHYAYVEMGCLDGPTHALHEIVGRLASHGVARIVFLPTVETASDERVKIALAEQVQAQQALYPKLELVIVSTQLTIEDHARVLVHNVAQVLEPEESGGGVVPLSFLPPRQSGLVFRLSGGHEFISRLAALGFIPGAPVKVVQNFGVGPLIVSVRGTRIALGREEARKVRVQSQEPSDIRPTRRGRRHRKEGDFE